MAGRALPRLLATFALTFLAPLCVCQAAWAQAQPHRTVLTVHWSSEDFPINALRDAAIRKVLLSSDVPIDYYAEYLESDRFPAEEASLALRDSIARKFRGRRIDVVLAVQDVALQFVLRFRGELFPDAPIVYLGFWPPDESVRNSSVGITGVVMGPAYDSTLELALKLHPSTERVLVVTQVPDPGLEKIAQASLGTLERRIKLDYVAERSLPGLLAAIKAAPARSLVYYIRYSQEDPGRVRFPSDVVEVLAQASPVPVYVSTDSYIGSGVVGGMVDDTQGLATRAAEMALQILAGTRPQDIPFEQPARVPAFDWRQLHRWGISENRLPAGSRILFRQPRAWELYRLQILGFGVLMMLQSGLIALLLVQRARRRRTEARHSAILRAVPDLMFLQTTDGVYVDYHASDPGQLLRPPEQFLGKNMRDILPTVPLRQIEVAFAQATSAVGPVEPIVVEYDLELPAGNRRFEARLVRSSDNQILTLVRDITEQARAETALREGAQRYALASAAGAVGLWDWNFETNQLYIDAGLKSLLGFDDAEIGTDPEDWGARVHPQDVPIAAARVKACVDGDSDVYEVEHRMLHKDGSVKWVLSRGSAIRAEDGTLRRMVGTKVDITKLKRAEEAIRDNEAKLQASNEEILYLAGSLISAQDAERARMARDLHDDVSQQLAALSIALSGLKRRSRAAVDDDDLQSAISSIQERAVAVCESIRHLSLDLHPNVLRYGGLTAALTTHCAGVSAAHPIAITCATEGEVDAVDSETALSLYRIAQEALHNVVKHARAGRVEVQVVRNGDSVELTVGDDGQGFDAARTRKERRGLGLMSMSERVRLAKGTLSFVTEQGKGTQVRVWLPIAPRVTQDAGEAIRR